MNRVLSRVDVMVDSYHGRTYVAYLDISGFAEMMKDEDSAARILSRFYNTTYEFCQSSGRFGPGLSIVIASDSAIAFTRNRNAQDRLHGLLKLLKFVKSMNRSFIDSDSEPFTTICSIAYGQFVYENRSELDDLRKNYVFGSPYLKAVLDQKKGKPKLKPGDCRLLPPQPRLSGSSHMDTIPFIIKRGKWRYFYWMLEKPEDHSLFNIDYSEAYKNREKDDYRGVIQVLKKYTKQSSNKQRHLRQQH